ncbi:MAG: putative selenium-dependent hydroxylase accessory protein YqeC [Lachnospiraceae bacterium]|nr:putative selenium-dependent hydroxylase accessory protein YqeC [Lachnospiraceae bacterium]
MNDLLKMLSISPGITSVIGSGGKTTLLRFLAGELPGTVLLCTSTHIFPFEEYPLIISEPDEKADMLLPRLRESFRQSRVLCLGRRGENGKLVSPPVPFTALLSSADYILVEADGSAGLPMKAHAEYEPVIPEGNSRTILVAGASAFFRKISSVCHRPELFSAKTGTGAEDILSPALAARLINTENLSDFVFLNQADSLSAPEAADTFLKLINVPGTAGTLQPRS